MPATAIELIESLELLKQSLKVFSEALQRSKLPYWIPVKEGQLSLESTRQLYTDIWYKDGQDGRATIQQYGLIGADQPLIQLANEVNNYKALFRQNATDFQTNENTDTQHRSTLLTSLLSRQGEARLHLKQCYRQIPVLENTPAKVGFSWYTSGRSIKKITPQQALERLLKMDTSQSHIQLQIEAVGRLRPGDTLAQLQTQVPVMRANIVWKQNDQIIRKARNISLPILVQLDLNKPMLPEHNEPPLMPPEARSRIERSDLKIDPQPFLPSLRAHRYLG
ncbi:MAG: DNA replication terminus site-binding protein [Amphritea sp.]